jgi:hypothetical protein
VAPEDGLAPGRVLYHYTNAAGLLGILERRCLFASDVWFLNDASEVRYAQTRMLAQMRKWTDFASDQPWVEELLDVSETKPGWLDDVFVTSFCEEPDLLSQWRGYAAGGFAVGFAAEGLTALNRAPDAARLVQVDYGAESGRRRLRGLFEQLVAGGPYSQEERERLARKVLLPEMACVKEPSFSEEKEWRLLVVEERPERILFRVRATAVVPYVELNLPEPSPVCEIVIGPSVDQQMRRRGMEQLLARRGYHCVEIRESASSLRL